MKLYSENEFSGPSGLETMPFDTFEFEMPGDCQRIIYLCSRLLGAVDLRKKSLIKMTDWNSESLHSGIVEILEKWRSSICGDHSTLKEKPIHEFTNEEDRVLSFFTLIVMLNWECEFTSEDGLVIIKLDQFLQVRALSARKAQEVRTLLADFGIKCFT